MRVGVGGSQQSTYLMTESAAGNHRLLRLDAPSSVATHRPPALAPPSVKLEQLDELFAAALPLREDLLQLRADVLDVGGLVDDSIEVGGPGLIHDLGRQGNDGQRFKT